MNPLEKIMNWLQQQQLDGIILSRRDNFAWVTGGKKNNVIQSTELGVASLLVWKDRVDLITDNIDASRIFDEQINISAHLVTHPWYEDNATFIKEYIGEKKVVSDTGIAGTHNMQDLMIDLRLILCEEEQSLYREIGLECAHAVESVCLEAKPGWTENQVAYELKVKCLKVGINPDCVLVGSDERIKKYRHPMPTDKAIEKSLMVVLGGEKYGLNISLTRIVYFEEPSDIILKKHQLTQKIFAGMQEITRAGITYKDFFQKVKHLYKDASYIDEWQLHHQGGPTGYACRERIITSESNNKIYINQAFAWNPSITGTKCEETTLLTKNGLEILTRTNNWPTTSFSTENGEISVADILVRHLC